MEEKLAKIAASIIGGSFILSVLFMLLIFGIAMIASGDYTQLKNPFVIKIFVVSAMYISSIVLLATLPKKGIRRRFFSWLYSLAFHAGLLVYLDLINKAGAAILIVGLVEVAVIVLCALGLLALVHGNQKTKQV